MEDDYLSIKEFSTRADVTPQAIYKRLTSDLIVYTKVVNGKKMINISALALFAAKPVDNISQPADQPVCEIDNQLLTTLNNVVETLNTQLLVLTSQLTEKDKQIAEKDRQMAELSEHLRQSNTMNVNQQILLGRQQEKPKIEEINHNQEPEKQGFWSHFKRK